MLRKLLTAATIAAAVFIPNAAQAAPVYLGAYQGDDTWMVQNDRGENLFISVEFQDRVGDVAVRLCNGQDCDFTWLRCRGDLIADRYADNSSSQWRNVDHRKIEGWMSDAACGRLSR